MWKALIILAMHVCYSVGTIGDNCTYSADCTMNDTVRERCYDGFCQCDTDIEPHYTSLEETLTAHCKMQVDATEQLEVDACTFSSCEENSVCVEKTGNDSLSLNNYICICKEGFLHVDGECREVSYQRVLQPCSIPTNGSLLWCNLKEKSYCEEGLCICFDTYFANVTSGKCETMESYLGTYNLSEYRVKPEEYCRRKIHCLEGLTCKDYQCACPEPCTYNKTEDICECGDYYEMSEKSMAATLGIVLAFFIILFWVIVINLTVQRFTGKGNLIEIKRNGRFQNSHQVGPEQPKKPFRLSQFKTGVIKLFLIISSL